ncbi:sigma-70 family RNA polymerase sigma factor [Schlesneria paludicola]|uniref:sigma-70 family RNA polymerase sigma factor n=1 Tax=Schlesneria paludicola TaxID=360056 RepID=UPI00029A30A2|nr:sigma-70 family RNA polymerase sigma factor [Schlesneria paludicola]
MSDSSVSKDRLVEECQGLVRFLAQQIRSRTPSWVELDDLIGYGQVGLMQAARDFDPAQGTKFSTYAYYRIRGAIFDGVNKLNWCRSSRDAEFKFEQTADSVIQTNSGTTPPSESIAQEASWFTRTAGALAISYLAAADGEGRTADVVDKSAKAPWAGMVQRETHLQLADAIGRLPADAAALVRAVYYEDRTLQEAADQLKISKSWASRMHARALEQMARHMKQANFGDTPNDDDDDP